MSNQTPPPARSKKKIILGWLFVLGTTVITTALGFWWMSKRTAAQPDGGYGLGFAVVLFFIGGFFLVAGALGYVAVIFTECLTFNYQKPVLGGLKVRLYLANIIVPLLVMLGIGFMLAAFVMPLLRRWGLSGSVSYMIPLMGSLVVLQLVLVWVSVWTPVIKRLISKRLRAKGLTDAQLAGGLLLGISDPSKSSMKKFFMIESDLGMLWFDPAQLIYWGDSEDFVIRREDLLEIERKMDAASTSSLSGTVHVILRVAQPDGSERRIRLHNEGLWTLGSRRAAMDALAQQIEAWRSMSLPPVIN